MFTTTCLAASPATEAHILTLTAVGDHKAASGLNEIV